MKIDLNSTEEVLHFYYDDFDNNRHEIIVVDDKIIHRETDWDYHVVREEVLKVWIN